MDHEIKHIWFDLSGTLIKDTPEFDLAHNKLRYQTYADVIGKPVSPEVQEEYEALYKKAGSNSMAFSSLGLPSDYWMQQFDQLELDKYYKPVPEVYSTVDKLRKIHPISIFTNIPRVGIEKALKFLRMDVGWFSNIIDGDDVENRKPALDGFHQMIEKSNLPPENILYVGDRVKVDIRPAKELGMKTCLVYSESDEADFSFMNFEDLLTIFK